MPNILETKSKAFQKKVNEAPLVPGCYMYKNGRGTVLYVGKAKVLRKRVKSYFLNFDRLETRYQVMIDKAKDIELITVDTEVEALILENNLIKKYRPKYNIAMRDDKSYVYIRLEKVRRKNGPVPTKDSVYQDFPRVTVTREYKDDGAEYFGPYPDSTPVKKILRRLRRIFPYRTGNELVYIESFEPYKIFSSNAKPSLYYHIGLSNGVEAGLEKREDYLKNFNAVRKFFLGEKQDMIRELERDMKNAAKSKDFELAAKLRDRISDIKYVTANIRLKGDVDDTAVKLLKEKERKTAVKTLVEKLEFPEEKLIEHKGFRIECYDISNIQGTNAVGSMVVMIDGVIKPQLYRRFRIKMKNEPNDFAMLQEVLNRRLKYLLILNQSGLSWDDIKSSSLEELKYKLTELQPGIKKIDQSFAQVPDLICIDGGKGQLASTYKILHNFNLHNEIPIVGLAKREEEIFRLTDQFKDEINQIDDSSKFTRVKLPKRSAALQMMQRIRDEAHRFAITYHRNLRSKYLR